MTVPFHIPNSAKAAISVVNLDAVCADIARRWCGSFGIHDDLAVTRLQLWVTDALNGLPRDILTAGRVEALIHDLARDAIIRWFALQNIEAKGRTFDRIRHSFLLANRSGRFTKMFMDPDITGTALADALSSDPFAATPELRYREMPRQQL